MVLKCTNLQNMADTSDGKDFKFKAEDCKVSEISAKETDVEEKEKLVLVSTYDAVEKTKS